MASHQGCASSHCLVAAWFAPHPWGYLGGTLRDNLPTAQRQVCRCSTASHCQGEDMGQPPSPGTPLPLMVLHEASPWEGGCGARQTLQV